MKQDESGFTLIELLVTIAAFGIIVSSIVALFITIQDAQLRADYKESATRAAQREVESLRNNQFNALTPGEDINFTSELPSNLQNKSGTVEVSEPTPGLRRVDVTVSYQHKGKTYSVELSSMIGVIGITQ